jgi:hypothetical protein
MISRREDNQNKTHLASGRPRPVLMIPLRRCGSHALRLRLNFSPAFYSPYPLHIVDFMPLLPLYGTLADDRNYYRLIVDVVGLQAVNIVKWPGVTFDPSEIFEAIKDERRSVHRIVWELLLRAGEQHRASVVMDKSLDNIHYADTLMEILPDFLFLNVVRDPRAQVASMNRAIIHDFDSMLNAFTWDRAYRAARALAARHPERVLTIRYEDFLADPEVILRQVCTFMGIEFLPEMLDIVASSEARQLSTMSALWSSNASKPILANKDKFRQQLSAQEIETIETITADNMRHYGYEFMTAAASAPPDAAMVVAAEIRSADKRKQAWEQLAQENYRDYAQRRLRASYLADRAVSAREEMRELAAPVMATSMRSAQPDLQSASPGL